MELVASALELDSTPPVLSMSPDPPKVLASVVLTLSLAISALMVTDLDLMVTDLDLMVTDLDSDLTATDLVASAGELDSTLPELSMSPDLLRVLASVVLMLSLVTLGLTVMESGLMVTDLAWGLMDMESVASAGVWDSTLPVLSMSPDLPRVLVADIFTRIFPFYSY